MYNNNSNFNFYCDYFFDSDKREIDLFSWEMSEY